MLEKQLFSSDFFPKDAPERSIRVSLFRPQEEDDGIWSCPVSFKSGDRIDNSKAIGADPFQALIMAIEQIRVRISAADGNYLYLGREPLWAVLPRFVPFSFGKEVVDEIHHFIDEVSTYD